MKIYNEDHTQELSHDKLDFTLGHLITDYKIIKHHDKVEAKSVQEQVKELQAQGKEIEIYDTMYYLVLNKYASGGKDLRPITDIQEQEAWDETEEILVFKYFTQEELSERHKESLRMWRLKYLNILDRACWYDSLTSEQKEIAKGFRQQLLDITTTLTKPDVPEFISKEIKN